MPPKALCNVTEKKIDFYKQRKKQIFLLTCRKNSGIIRKQNKPVKRKKKHFIAGVIDMDLHSESGTVEAGWYEGCVGKTLIWAAEGMGNRETSVSVT